MRYIVLLILSILALNVFTQNRKPDTEKVNMFQKAIISSAKYQANNMGFIRFSQLGNNNKTILRTNGKDIDINSYQYGRNNFIDFDIYGKDSYTNISQSGIKNTVKGKCTLYNSDLGLTQKGKNNLIEFRNNRVTPGMIINQKGNGIKIIFY